MGDGLGGEEEEWGSWKQTEASQARVNVRERWSREVRSAAAGEFKKSRRCIFASKQVTG